MEIFLFIGLLIGYCFILITLALLGALGGFIGGKISSMVLKELDPNLPNHIHTGILKRSTLGFLMGGFVCGYFVSSSIEILNEMSIVHLSHEWASTVAVGFAFMGAIGTAIAGSALFKTK